MMDGLREFLEMGGYAGYVWPAFGIAVLVLAGLLFDSLRRLRSNEALLRAIEAEDATIEHVERK